MQHIDLFLDADNELVFKVKVEGTRPGKSSCRLIVEGNDIDYMFKGDFISQDEVSIVIPPLSKMIKEGKYSTKLEVLVDDRIFVPLTMDANFEKSVTVQAESVVRGRKKATATASLVTSPVKNKITSRNEKSNIQRNINENIKKIKKSDITDKQIQSLIHAAIAGKKWKK